MITIILHEQTQRKLYQTYKFTLIITFLVMARLFLWAFAVCRLSDKRWTIPNGTFAELTSLGLCDCLADNPSFENLFSFIK